MTSEVETLLKINKKLFTISCHLNNMAALKVLELLLVINEGDTTAVNLIEKKLSDYMKIYELDDVYEGQ